MSGGVPSSDKGGSVPCVLPAMVLLETEFTFYKELM